MDSSDNRFEPIVYAKPSPPESARRTDRRDLKPIGPADRVAGALTIAAAIVGFTAFNADQEWVVWSSYLIAAVLAAAFVDSSGAWTPLEKRIVLLLLATPPILRFVTHSTIGISEGFDSWSAIGVLVMFVSQWALVALLPLPAIYWYRARRNGKLPGEPIEKLPVREVMADATAKASHITTAAVEAEYGPIERTALISASIASFSPFFLVVNPMLLLIGVIAAAIEIRAISRTPMLESADKLGLSLMAGVAPGSLAAIALIVNANSPNEFDDPSSLLMVMVGVGIFTSALAFGVLVAKLNASRRR